jgi:hypothetical protein
VIDNHLKEHFERHRQRQEKRNDEDYDDGVEELLIDEVSLDEGYDLLILIFILLFILKDDEDVYILSKVADILHSLFVAYKHQFLPYFDLIYQHFINLAVSPYSLLFKCNNQIN